MSAKESARGTAQILFDLRPIIIFVAAFNLWNRVDPANAIYAATIIFMATTAGLVALAYFQTRKVPPVLLVSGALVLAFGGLTLLLRDETFVKMKPTFAYLFYAAAILGTMAAGKNIWKLLFAHAFTLPDRVWRILAMRWGCFFVAMAAVNEAIRLTQPTDVRVNSRLFIGFPLVIAFMALNLPITLKNIGKGEG
jgi:intracellular septation protein